MLIKLKKNIQYKLIPKDRRSLKISFTEQTVQNQEGNIVQINEK